MRFSQTDSITIILCNRSYFSPSLFSMNESSSEFEVAPGSHPHHAGEDSVCRRGPNTVNVRRGGYKRRPLPTQPTELLPVFLIIDSNLSDCQYVDELWAKIPDKAPRYDECDALVVVVICFISWLFRQQDSPIFDDVSHALNMQETRRRRRTSNNHGYIDYTAIHTHYFENGIHLPSLDELQHSFACLSVKWCQQLRGTKIGNSSMPELCELHETGAPTHYLRVGPKRLEQLIKYVAQVRQLGARQRSFELIHTFPSMRIISQLRKKNRLLEPKMPLATTSPYPRQLASATISQTEAA